MTDNRGFPLELLAQSNQQRLDYFDSPNITVMHRNLLRTYDKVHRGVLKPAGASIILVIGPSGAGKTTLLRLIEKKILESSLTQMEIEPSWIPIVCVEAIPPGKDAFRWKNFYKRTLIAVDEPGIEQKFHYDSDGIHRGRDGKLQVRAKATEDALRLSLEKALSHRRPYTLAVDEFQDIGKMASQQVLESHMDTVKSIVNITKIPWTGVGTYQLLDFLELSPQLSRRTKIIHLQRYRLEENEDLKEFKRVLQHFQYRMPLQETPPLKEKYWEFCYEQSIGCIGTLKDWLTDALDLALSERATTLTIEHLEQTARLTSVCEQMALDAMSGEERLTDNPKKRQSLRILLGLEKDSGGASQVHQGGSRSKKEKKPFKRKPKRDAVGGESV